MPSLHAVPVEHALPHAPQLFRSTFRLKHPLGQDDVGAGQPHCAFAHCAPPVHATLHAPQLLGSFCVLTHAPLQSTFGAVHDAAHALSLQTCEAPHAVVHAPQCAGSLFRSTHTPPQSVREPGHPHWPPLHAKPAAH